MRRGSVVALLISLVLAIVGSQGMSLSTLAQDATPPSGQQAGVPEGVSMVTAGLRHDSRSYRRARQISCSGASDSLRARHSPLTRRIPRWTSCT